MRIEDVNNDLRKFIVDNFYFGEELDFSDSDSFLEKGIIDSTGTLELIAYLEKTYHIKVNDQDLTPENLDSVDRLAAFIERKTEP